MNLVFGGLRRAVSWPFIMASALFAIGVFVILSFYARGAEVQQPPLDLTGYTMTFNDEFSTLSISPHGPTTQWIAHTPWNGDFGAATFDDPTPAGPFFTSPDGLVIEAQKDNKGKWHSGLICSVDRDGAQAHGFTQKYGYFEMKAMLPTGPGTWPAFWLIGTDKSKSASEIDVVEYYGAFDGYIHSTEDVWSVKKDQKSKYWAKMTKLQPGILSRQFNTFGVLIGPQRTIFYFNRHEIWSTPTPPEYNQPMYMLADLAIGGGWPYDKLASPQKMEIQYIRAYQRSDALN